MLLMNIECSDDWLRRTKVDLFRCLSDDGARDPFADYCRPRVGRSTARPGVQQDEPRLTTRQDQFALKFCIVHRQTTPLGTCISHRLILYCYYYLYCVGKTILFSDRAVVRKIRGKWHFMFQV